MKKIKLNQKLALNKQLVSNLNEGEMSALKGGGFTSLGKKCTHAAGGCGDNITKGFGCKKTGNTGTICTVTLACEDIPDLPIPKTKMFP